MTDDIKTTRAAVTADDDATLAQFGLQDLPVVFSMRNDDGSITQEKDACYRCAADGFYGRGTSGTWYQEGSIIVTDVVPNQHLEPLNRAAGRRYVQWASRLPQTQVPIDIGDMSEAMTMLAARPDFLAMTPEQRSEAAIKLAVGIKLKREGRNSLDLPGLTHNFAPQSGGKAPPILGAKMSDMTQRGPGSTQAASVIPAGQQGGVRRAQSTLGGTPPAR